MQWRLDYSCNGEAEVVKGLSAICIQKSMNTKWSAERETVEFTEEVLRNILQPLG